MQSYGTGNPRPRSALTPDRRFTGIASKMSHAARGINFTPSAFIIFSTVTKLGLLFL